MTAYLITTPKNPNYDGKIFGIKFYAGKAVLSNEMLNARLGYTVEGIKAALERDYPGYEIRPLSNKAQKALEAVLEAEEPEAEAKKASRVKKE